MDTQTEEDIRAENALIDAQQLAASLPQRFVDSDIIQYEKAGVDLYLGVQTYLRRYEGTGNNFLRSVKSYLNRHGRVTQAQARAVLNVMRDEILSQFSDDGQPDEPTGIPPEITCLMCNEQFKSYDLLDEHKVRDHGSESSKQEAFSDEGEAADVLEVNTSTKGLDLSNLPDGRYAAPDQTGQNDYIFLVVKRVRNTKKRDRRYNYGKIVTGNEIVVAGTIEVRIWSSDTKEWVGQQKPGDVYRGKYEEELELIMMMPEPWAILFGRLLGYCGRCGKRLTDDVSREIGLGLECEKKRDYFNRPPKYTFIGKDRPDKEKVNPLDEKYIQGKLTHWVEPPPVPSDEEASRS